LGLPVEGFWRTRDADANFARALQELFDTLSLNILAALYQAAMKGNVTAQQFWLRQRPPAVWARNETSPAHEWEALSDAELCDYAQDHGVELPADVVAQLRPPREPPAS
jgi:hypothetical protein